MSLDSRHWKSFFTDLSSCVITASPTIVPSRAHSCPGSHGLSARSGASPGHSSPTFVCQSITLITIITTSSSLLVLTSSIPIILHIDTLFPQTFRQAITGQSTRTGPSRPPQDPTAVATRFLREYEEAYGTQHPNFYAGGYSAVSYLYHGPLLRSIITTCFVLLC